MSSRNCVQCSCLKSINRNQGGQSVRIKLIKLVIFRNLEQELTSLLQWRIDALHWTLRDSDACFYLMLLLLMEGLRSKQHENEMQTSHQSGNGIDLLLATWTHALDCLPQHPPTQQTTTTCIEGVEGSESSNVSHDGAEQNKVNVLPSSFFYAFPSKSPFLLPFSFGSTFSRTNRQQHQ